MKKKRIIKSIVAMILLLSISSTMVFAAGTSSDAGEFSDKESKATFAEGDTLYSDEGYTLEKVVVLSRHNLRAPLSSSGSVPQELTPHNWIEWTAPSSELTLKGGMLETNMGQYFRKWYAKEGFIPENYIPEEGEFRFYARDKQRCRATARYFATGFDPVADITVEHPGSPNNLEDFMEPVIHSYSDEFADAIIDEKAQLGGEEGFEGISKQTRDAIELIMDVVDMKDSKVYQSGKYGDLLKSRTGFKVEPGQEPDLTGAVKTVSQVVDALILQYYEEPDAVKAAFGHDLTDEQWQTIGDFITTYLTIKHGTHLAAVDITHPLLEELESELTNEDRKLTFFCAHDCTVMGTLAALGSDDYTLPDSLETRTPIGVKLMFDRLRDEDGKTWYHVYILYRSTDQIRDSEELSLDNPPLRYDIVFDGIETNEDGLISEDDLLQLFDNAIQEYDELETKYEIKPAA